MRVSPRATAAWPAHRRADARDVRHRLFDAAQPSSCVSGSARWTWAKRQRTRARRSRALRASCFSWSWKRRRNARFSERQRRVSSARWISMPGTQQHRAHHHPTLLNRYRPACFHASVSACGTGPTMHALHGCGTSSRHDRWWHRGCALLIRSPANVERARLHAAANGRRTLARAARTISRCDELARLAGDRARHDG